MRKKILVTGTAGFIGFHMANRLLADGHEVVGIDSINEYYDPGLKYGRLAEVGIEKEAIEYGKPAQSIKYTTYTFYWLELEEKEKLLHIFEQHQFDYVIHLAAQAGVRYSMVNPDAYVSSNIVAFMNMLECSRHHHISHFVYASSSSIYGINDSIPFSVSQNADHPISLYAATKKSNELMAHVYSHVYQLPTTGLRFFTVYGAWGRPDMALFIFTKSILEGKPVQVFNNGKMNRDFTYIDDITEGVNRIMHHIPESNKEWKASNSDASASSAPYKVYNIGNNKSVSLMDFIEAIETELGIKSLKEFLPLQPGDLETTFADITELINDVGYTPSTKLAYGVAQFVQWYKAYYKV